MSLDLPLEVWSQIMDACDIETLKAVAHVSRSCREEVMKRLLRSVYYADSHSSMSGPGIGQDVAGTRIKDLTRLYRTLRTTNFSWRSYIQHAHFGFSRAGHSDSYQDHKAGTNETIRGYELIIQISMLFSDCPNLKSLHFTLPGVCSEVPSKVPGVTSLTVPMKCYAEDEPEWQDIFNLFQIRSLRHVKLDEMLRLNHKERWPSPSGSENLDAPPFVPERFRKTRISNITHLTFTHCGLVSDDIEPMLAWLVDLQSLVIDVQPGRNSCRFPNHTQSLSPNGFLRALRPVRHSLRKLQLSFVGHADEWRDEPLPQEAFRWFEKLERLTIPLELIWQFSDEDINDHPGELAPPFHSSLPDSLREFHLEILSSVDNSTDLHLAPLDRNAPCSSALEFIYEIKGLIEWQPDRFGQLSEVRVDGNRQNHRFAEDCEMILLSDTLVRNRDVLLKFYNC